MCGQSNASQPLAEMFAEPLDGTRLRLAPLQERSGSEMLMCLCRHSQPASCPSTTGQVGGPYVRSRASWELGGGSRQRENFPLLWEFEGKDHYNSAKKGHSNCFSKAHGGFAPF